MSHIYRQSRGRKSGVCKLNSCGPLSARSEYWQPSLEPAADNWYKGFWGNVFQSEARHCRRVIFSLITKWKNVTLRGMLQEFSWVAKLV